MGTGQRGEWIPPNAPLSEGYWQALLHDGAHGRAAPIVTGGAPWRQAVSDSSPSLEQADESDGAEDPWDEARTVMAEGEVLELPVVGANRGGLLVSWQGLRGFVPASHLLELDPSAGEEERREELRRLIGTRLRLKIIELDEGNDRFVLSERATQVDDRPREEVLGSLEPGEVCQGRVTNLCSFGAFVDLGGFEGLVHISELSWGRVGRPSDVLELGQAVQVYVLNVEPERERVGLSLKRLQPNPWESVEERYSVGQIVKGTVTHVVDFGAFVQVEEGLEGLIHVSELGSMGPRQAQDVLREGDRVSVIVLDIDRARRRMGLRLERVWGDEPAPGPAEREVETVASGE